MSIDTDVHASYKLLSAEFEKNDYAVAVFAEDDRTVVEFTSPHGKVWKTAAAHIGYPFNSRFVRDCSRNKEIATDFVAAKGMSVPETLHITSLPSEDDIRGLLERHQTLVVKPSDASLSKGLSVNLTTVPTVLKAIDRAKEFSSAVIVQQQVVGEEIRFAVLNGKVVAALLRETPRVTGDGRLTVRQLIDQENKKRESLKFPFVSYPQLDASLIDATFLESDVVLSDGEVLELSGATMIKAGCSIYDVLPQIDKSYIAEVEDIVSDLGAGFIVVDIFLKDMTTPAQQNNYWFIEFNTAPVLKLFYGCRDGKMFDIVPLLFKAIDAHLHRV